MFQAFTLVWQTVQNRRLHKTGGTCYQSCMDPADSAWPAFLMPFLLLLPGSGNLCRGFTVSPTKHAYSVLHPQALTECSPLDFQRSSIRTRRKKLRTTCIQDKVFFSLWGSHDAENGSTSPNWYVHANQASNCNLCVTSCFNNKL